MPRRALPPDAFPCRAASYAFLFASVALLGSCREHIQGARPVAWVLQGRTMGTSWKVLYPRTYPHDAGLKSAIDALLVDVNAAMSTYDRESEISRFNASRATGEWFACSKAFARVVERALEIHAQSEKAFDPTVGPLVNLWGFGPGDRRDAPPADTAIEAVRAHVGAGLLSVRTTPPALRKRKAEVYVDLSAIAKGYAVDAVGRLLDERNVGDWFVEIGGEIRTKGYKRPRLVDPSAPAHLRIEKPRAWTVAVELPSESPSRRGVRYLELRDAAVATSGDYRNFFRKDGKRFAHGIDPRTGRPAEHALASVSVIATTCEDADAWATALLILGPNDAKRLAEAKGLAALLLVRTDSGFEPWQSTAFTKRYPQDR